MIRTQDEIRAERPPLVLTDGPETGLSATESADWVETGTDPRVSESEAAETLSGGAA